MLLLVGMAKLSLCSISNRDFEPTGQSSSATYCSPNVLSDVGFVNFVHAALSYDIIHKLFQRHTTMAI